MICKIAVAGTGAIGAMMGGWLTRSGYDVTMLSLYRAEQAQRLSRDGLTLEGYGQAFHTPVRAELLAQLPASEQFDFIFLTMKSNALEETLPALAAHLRPEGALIPMQNGINDALLEQAVPRRQIVTCVTFAGGAQLVPGRFMNHDGHRGHAAGAGASGGGYCQPCPTHGGHVQDPRFPVGQAVQGVPVCSDGLHFRAVSRRCVSAPGDSAALCRACAGAFCGG